MRMVIFASLKGSKENKVLDQPPYPHGSLKGLSDLAWVLGSLYLSPLPLLILGVASGTLGTKPSQKSQH
jgi:hypothetical protein